MSIKDGQRRMGLPEVATRRACSPRPAPRRCPPCPCHRHGQGARL